MSSPIKAAADRLRGYKHCYAASLKETLTYIQENNLPPFIKETRHSKHTTIRNYNYIIATIELTKPYHDPYWEVLRNFRGLVTNGAKILAMPLPKFYNLNENPLWGTDTQGDIIKIVPKIDGSLLYPFINPYTHAIEWKTRGGFGGEVQQSFLRWWAKPTAPDGTPLDKGELEDFIRALEGYTLLFEWQDPNKPIVIVPKAPVIRLIGLTRIKNTDYEIIPDFAVLLDYLSKPWRNTLKPQFWGANEADVLYNQLHRCNDLHCIENIMKKYAHITNIEGFVVYLARSECVQMMKIKTRWYFEVHKLATDIHSFWKAIMDNEIDDFLASLRQNNLYAAADRYEAMYNDFLEKVLETAEIYMEAATLLIANDRKIDRALHQKFKAMGVIIRLVKELTEIPDENDRMEIAIQRLQAIMGERKYRHPNS